MKELKENDKKALESVKRKIKKGFKLTELYWCGIPKWRFIKGKIVSNCPRVSENLVCDVLKDNGIIVHKHV